ncbi:MAG: hypothetical protein M0037_02305 [Betaproteobacteria bacterium]|nr:hypothetical protein [Betaproteobacteria bacterium]
MQLKLAVPAHEETGDPAIETRPAFVGDWLASLPLTNPIEAARSARDGLYALNRRKIAEDQRLKLLELYLLTIEQLLSMLEPYYLGMGLPIPDKGRQAATVARELLGEAAYGYKILLMDQADRRSAIRANKPLTLIVERAVSALSGILVVCYETYAPTPAGVWAELHQLFRYAFEHKIHDEPVEHGNETRSVTLAYKQTLLLALTDPYRLMQGEVNLVLDYLARFGQEAHLIQAGESARPLALFLVSLESDKPPRALAQVPQPPNAASDILLDTLELARKIYQDLSELEAGTDPHTLHLPVQAKAASYRELLRRLLKHWGASPKRHYPRTPASETLELCAGLRALHHFLGGGAQGHASAQDITDISIQVAPSPLDAASRTTYRSMRWATLNESAGGIAAAHTATEKTQVRVGEIVGLRANDQEPWHVGVVRWMKAPAPQQLELGIQMLSPTAKPIEIRPVVASPGEEFMPALLLPEVPLLKQEAALVALGGTFSRMRELELRDGDSQQNVRAMSLREQGNGFELIDIA